MSFADDIKAFEKKALLAANISVSKAAEDLFTSIVALSPTSTIGKYSKNHLINQWWSDIGGINSSSSDATSPTGADSLARIKASIAQKPFLGKDNMISLTNNLDYAYRAEETGWRFGEGTNGWVWTGNVGPYKMVKQSVDILRAKHL